MKRIAIVIGGSKGIGKAIAESLHEIGCEVIATSRKDIDTSDLESVKTFAHQHHSADILVLNTGGPPKKVFSAITIEDWNTYHNQLFVSFCLLLQNLRINNNGYIFLISSHKIKSPDPSMVLSSAYRLAFWSVLKSLSQIYASRNVSCINIAPGPIMTERLISLVQDVESFERTLPLGRAGYPDEIGKLVSSIVKHEIKYLNGVTIELDGGLSTGIF